MIKTTNLRRLGFHLTVIFALIFVQFVYVNILPREFNGVDLFLIVSGLYILKSDYRLSLPFVFVSTYVDDVIFPIAKISGVKTLSALILGYIMYLIFKRLMLKGVLLCVTVAFYYLLVIILSKFLLFLLGYGAFSFKIAELIILWTVALLLTCFIEKKLNVW